MMTVIDHPKILELIQWISPDTCQIETWNRHTLQKIFVHQIEHLWIDETRGWTFKPLKLTTIRMKWYHRTKLKLSKLWKRTEVRQSRTTRVQMWEVQTKYCSKIRLKFKWGEIIINRRWQMFWQLLLRMHMEDRDNR